MRLREKKKQELWEDEELTDTGVTQSQLEQTEERTILLEALDQLNETERQIVLLYAAAGLKHPGDRPGVKYASGNGIVQIQPFCEKAKKEAV